jgi:hypothetical protein
MRTRGSNSDGKEFDPEKAGRRLALTFLRAPTPELTRIEFQYDKNSDPVPLELHAPEKERGFKWGRSAKSFALFFLDYASWEHGDAVFRFPQREAETHLAVALGYNSFKPTGIAQRLFVEKNAKGEKGHVGEVFTVENQTGTTRPGVVRVRHNFLPSKCIEIISIEDGKLDKKRIGDLAGELRASLPPRADVSGDEPSTPQLKTQQQSKSSRAEPGHNVQMLSPQDSIPAYIRVLIADTTRDFVGREYIFREIEKFLANTRNGYFQIEAEPGEGKTTILAEYVKRHGCPAYFNSQSEGRTSSEAFVKSLTDQLTARFKLKTEECGVGPLASAIDISQLLQQASVALGSDGKLVIVVDALDEVDSSTRIPGENILHFPTTLPPRVFFLTSARRTQRVLLRAQSIQTLKLADFGTQTLMDIEQFLKNAAKRPALSGWLRGKAIPSAAFSARLAEKSEGNFMYVYCIVTAIERGRYEDLNFEALPTGLTGYYQMHWERMGMSGENVDPDRLKTLYTLSQVREPVSAALLAEFTQVDILKVQQILNGWTEFLRLSSKEAEETLFSIYHKSFSDFLEGQDILSAIGISRPDIHEAIAAVLLKERRESD